MSQQLLNPFFVDFDCEIEAFLHERLLVAEGNGLVGNWTFDSLEHYKQKLVFDNIDSIFLKKIVEDQFLSNEDKIEKYIECLHENSTISIVTGGRGSGKTATTMKTIQELQTVNLVKEMYGLTRPIYIMTEPFKGTSRPKPKRGFPPYVKWCISFDEAPYDSIVITDEAHIKLFSVNSNKNDSASDEIKNLTIARHKGMVGKSIFYITQNTSLLVKGIFKLVDMIITKRLSLMQRQTERDELLISTNILLQPITQSETLIVSNDFISLLELDLPNTWNDEQSKSFG